MATIRDVAEMAGVSVGTVSNMINSKGTVSEEKYSKIKNAMEVLNYKPNYMAQNLKTKKDKVIGIILPNLDEPYSDIYEGIVDVLDMKGYITVLKLTQNNIVLENQFLDQLVGIGVIGIIIVPSECNNVEKYREIKNKGIAFVVVERKLEGIEFSNVLFENKKLVYGITKNILEQNPQSDIKLIVGKQEFTNEKDCADGYLTARDNRQEDVIVIKETRKEAIFDHIYRRIIRLEKVPDCIIASSLEFAKIILEVCNILYYDVDIHAIIGEKWYTTNLYKKINLYGRNAILMGKQASKLLIELMRNKHLAEDKTIYIQSKKNYKNVQIEIMKKPKSNIRVLAFQCDATNALEKLSHSFKNATGIEVAFDKKGYTELREELNHQINEQLTDYDIVMMDIPWMRSILAKDYLVDISSRAKVDELLEYYPSGVRSAFYKGDRGMHLIPVIATVQTIMYRKDIFSDRDIKAQFEKMYGYELSAPETWTNFNNIVEFFDRRYNPDSPFEYGTAATSLEPIGLINEFLPRQWAFHGNIMDQWGKISIDSEENVRALDNLIKTFEHTPKKAEQYFWDEIFEMLIKGKIPMAHGFASHYQPGNYSQLGNTYEKYIKGMPVPGGKTMLGGWALGINKYSSNIDTCYEFLKWNLYDKIAISNMRLCGCMPTITVFKDESLKNNYQWLNLINEKFNIGGLREEIYDHKNRVVDLEIIDSILSKGIKKAIHKEVDSTLALKEIKENLSEILKRA